MRRVLALAFCAIAAPAAPQVSQTALDAVFRAPPTAGLEMPLRAAPCAFAPVAEHLGWLPANMPWARPAAVVMVTDLPGLEPGHRAAVLRPTRELLARAATRERIAEGGITLHGPDLSLLPAGAPAPAFLAIHVAPPATPPQDCHAQTPR